MQIMADYYPLIRKAIDKLERPDRNARYDIYQLARDTLVRQLRDMDRPDREIDEQDQALKAAIVRIESELGEEHARQEPAKQRPPERTPVAAEPALETPRDHVPAAPRPWARVAIGGTLAIVLLAGLGAYYFAARDRTSSPPTSRTPPAQPATVASAPGSNSSEAESAHASYILRRQRIFYRTTHPAGTVIVSRNQRFLYLVQANQVAIRYAIGVGPACEKIAGMFRITEKVDRPAAGGAEARTGQATPSRPPAASGARFGAPALHFGELAVHRATEPRHVGLSAPVGCFHSWNEDIGDLYDRVPLDERLVVMN